MQDDQVEQTDESGEDATRQPELDSEDSAIASAVDQQAAESSGTAAEAEPEVPDDASQKIAAAQDHINRLNMDNERDAAKRTQKRI